MTSRHSVLFPDFQYYSCHDFRLSNFRRKISRIENLPILSENHVFHRNLLVCIGHARAKKTRYDEFKPTKPSQCHRIFLSNFFSRLQLFFTTSNFFTTSTFFHAFNIFFTTSTFFHDFNFMARLKHSGMTLIFWCDFFWHDFFMARQEVNTDMANSLVHICMIGLFSCLNLFLLTRIIALALFLFEPSQNCFTYSLVC